MPDALPVDAVICWLTGYNQRELERQFDSVTAAKLFTVGAEELFAAPFAAG